MAFELALLVHNEKIALWLISQGVSLRLIIFLTSSRSNTIQLPVLRSEHKGLTRKMICKIK